jgi:hypothetical protein
MARAKAAAPPVETFPYDFEGTEVRTASAIVRKTGDGLSEEMRFAPFVVHKGERRFLVLDVECTDVHHPWTDKKDHSQGAIRRHIFDASTGLFLDDDIIREAVERQEKRIAEFREVERIAKEEAKGVFRLSAVPGGDPDDF